MMDELAQDPCRELIGRLLACSVSAPHALAEPIVATVPADLSEGERVVVLDRTKRMRSTWILLAEEDARSIVLADGGSYLAGRETNPQQYLGPARVTMAAYRG